MRLNTWQGFRFDIWLKQQNLGDFATIRFESSNRYQVTLEKANLILWESYLVTGQDGIPFEENMLRLIFSCFKRNAMDKRFGACCAGEFSTADLSPSFLS